MTGLMNLGSPSDFDAWYWIKNYDRILYILMTEACVLNW